KAPCVSNRDQPSGFLATTRALSAGCSRGVRRLRRGGLARAEACLARRHIVLPFQPRSPEAEKMCIAMHGALPRFDPGKGENFRNALRSTLARQLDASFHIREEGAIGIRNTLAQTNSRSPAQRSQSIPAQQLTGGAIGLGKIVHNFALEADNLRDQTC